MASCVLVHFQGLHSDKALFRMPVFQRSYREQEFLDIKNEIEVTKLS